MRHDRVGGEHRRLIESNRSAARAQVQFDIAIPPDATALVELPAGSGDVLLEGGRPNSQAAGIERLAPGPAVHRLRVGIGRYRSTSTRTR
jgi:hypothetical protein